MEDFLKAYGKGLLWLVGIVGAVFAYRLINMLFDRLFPPEGLPQARPPVQQDPLGLYSTTQAARGQSPQPPGMTR